MNIGLTGGIASGKSTVSSYLVAMGAVLIDADQIAREVVLPGSPALGKIKQLFGSSVITDEGTLNRKKLGEHIFANELSRKQLEGILHPEIRAIMKQRMNELEADNPRRLVVVDVPLLFESGLASMFEMVMLVYVPREVQLERLMNRDGLSRVQAEARLEAQMPIEQKIQLADFIIDNSGTPEETGVQVQRFWQEKGL
ncbi:MAG: dephospho-CoA kinase [Paenibacillaceae bacterium]